MKLTLTQFIPILLLFFSACGSEEERIETKPLPIKKVEVLNDQPSNAIPYGFLTNTEIEFPVEGFELTIPLYDVPNGQVVDTVKMLKVAIPDSYLSLFEQDQSYEKLLKQKNDFYIVTGDKSKKVYLKYYGVKDGFIEVLKQDSTSRWLAYGDINTFLKPIRFIDYLSQYTKANIYGYNNYRLRAKPILTGEIVVKLDETKHVIKSFEEIKGSWAKAVIYELKQPLKGCYTDEELMEAWTKNEFTGWVRIVDENGEISDILPRDPC